MDKDEIFQKEKEFEFLDSSHKCNFYRGEVWVINYFFKEKRKTSSSSL